PLVEQALAWAIPRFAAADDGDALASHAAGTVLILAGLHTDAATRAAALIANTPEVEWGATARGKPDPLGHQFGDDTAQLVRGYHALVRVGMVTRESAELQRQGESPQVEKTRKMMLAMAAD